MLVREHGASMWRALRRLGVHEAEVDDVCQEVFLVAHRRANEFEGRSSARTWLFGIAVRLAANHRRKQRPTEGQDVLETLPSQAWRSDPEDSLARKEARALLERALAELDDDKREVFVLYELEELPMSEIARIVGCPLQTAYSRLHAARDRVERAFAKVDEAAKAGKAGTSS